MFCTREKTSKKRHNKILSVIGIFHRLTTVFIAFIHNKKLTNYQSALIKILTYTLRFDSCQLLTFSFLNTKNSSLGF